MVTLCADGSEPSLGMQLMGGAQAAFGAVEGFAAAMAAVAPEPVLTKGAAVFLVAHGADNIQAGGRSLMTGCAAETLTEMAVEKVATELGASEDVSEAAGNVVNGAVAVGSTAWNGGKMLYQAGRNAGLAQGRQAGELLTKDKALQHGMDAAIMGLNRSINAVADAGDVSPRDFATTMLKPENLEATAKELYRKAIAGAEDYLVNRERLHPEEIEMIMYTLKMEGKLSSQLGHVMTDLQRMLGETLRQAGNQ